VSTVRATDSEREQTASVLRAAAGEGCLTVDELETRLSQAYGAVTRAELHALVSDLPVLTPAARAPAEPVRARPSRFWIWALVPYFGVAAWVHAAFLTRLPRHWTYAVIYAIPLALAGIFDNGTADESDLPGWVIAVAIGFWIVGGLQAWFERPTVERLRAKRAQAEN
jgi:hypothetical protein